MWLVSQVANTIAAFEDKKLVRYNGDYKFYMDSNAKLAEKVCVWWVCVCLCVCVRMYKVDFL